MHGDGLLSSKSLIEVFRRKTSGLKWRDLGLEDFLLLGGLRRRQMTHLSSGRQGAGERVLVGAGVGTVAAGVNTMAFGNWTSHERMLINRKDRCIPGHCRGR